MRMMEKIYLDDEYQGLRKTWIEFQHVRSNEGTLVDLHVNFLATFLLGRASLIRQHDENGLKNLIS